MKCFLAVNQLNSPVFLDFDEDFTKFIHKKAVETGLRNADDECDSAEVDTTVVTQLFSPLVLSQVPLDDQVQNPCTSITCDGLLLVFRKLDDIQYIAISGDEKDTVEFLQKKILAFIQLTRFLFGPVYMEIANCPSSERIARWNFLKGVLHTWTHLANRDHTFLVEALERLHVNQLVSEKCVGLLEKTVNRMQMSADQPTQHAFLLVNTKLLALYSKRSAFELQPADILLTTLLTQDMFPCKDSLEEFLSSTPTYPAQPNMASRTGSSVSVSSMAADDRGVPQGSARSSTREEGSGHTLRGDTGDEGGASSKDRDERSDENEEFHSAPTTPSQRSLSPDTDADVIHGLLANPRHDGDSIVGDTEGQRGGGLGAEEDRDGGLERLISAMSSSHKGSVSSENRGSTTGSSVVDTEFPPLSYQNAPGLRPRSTGPLLSGRLSASELAQRSRSSTTDARHSDGSQRTPSERSLPTAEPGGGPFRGSTEQFAQSTHTQGGMGNDYWPHIVFLQTPACAYTPHALHCAQILPNITLVVVSQIVGHIAADPICQVLSIVQDLLQGRRNKLSRPQSLHVHEVISDLLRKVHNITRKFKRRIQNSSMDVLTRWESNEMREKLVTYLLQEERTLMLPDLESALMDFQRRLKELFQLLFVAPGRLGGGDVEGMGEGSREVMSKMKARLQKELMDYRDYLEVKAQRNITMTSYLDEFPGLVHFIYVDRQFHQMTAPSFNLMPLDLSKNATLFIKEKIWRMYSYMTKKLQQGYTSVLLWEGDFCFSFFLWFEDSSGNPIPVQEPFKPGSDTPLPGTLTSSFYKRLLRQCFPNRVEGAVHCYEMFLMHVGLVTPPYVASHCQKLSEKLWQMSGEAYTPVNLL